MGGQFERISTRAVPRIAAERGHRGHFGMDRADVGRVRQKKHLFIRLVHGEGGIRTLDTGFSPYNGLANSVRTAPVARNQPLSLSIGLAVRTGFCHSDTNMHHFMHHCGQVRKPLLISTWGLEPQTWRTRSPPPQPDGDF